MRVSHRIRNLQKQAQPLAHAERAAPAEFQQRQAVDVLHDEVRLAAGRSAAIEQTRDSRMLQLRQDLPLALETKPGLGVGVRGGDELDRHLLAVLAVGPLAQVDHAHAAAADLLHHPVRSDGFRRRSFGAQLGARRHRRIEQRAGFLLHSQQRFHRAAQLAVGSAQPVHRRGALAGVRFQHARQNRLDLAPASRGHGCAVPSMCSSSHSRAVPHSRFTVAGEIPRHSAVSSIERPPK